MSVLALTTVASWASTAAHPGTARAATLRRPEAATDPGPHGPDWSGARTVDYCVEDGRALAMTLFAPADADHPVPVVVQVHGGGWLEGGRLVSLTDGSPAGDLVAAGIMVASVDYGLVPERPWPDQIIDVKCAVRFLRFHAAELGIEPDRMAALGSSAGGQLVALLATTGDSTLWDAGPYGDVPSRVEAVVDEFGPADLGARDWPPSTAGLIHRVFGAAPDSGDPVLAAASPVTHVAAGDPPFMIVQGTDDQVVPSSQSELLADRLRSVGVRVDLVLVDRGRHGLGTPGEDPSAPAISSLITAFLRHQLG